MEININLNDPVFLTKLELFSGVPFNELTHPKLAKEYLDQLIARSGSMIAVYAAFSNIETTS